MPRLSACRKQCHSNEKHKPLGSVQLRYLRNNHVHFFGWNYIILPRGVEASGDWSFTIFQLAANADASL